MHCQEASDDGPSSIFSKESTQPAKSFEKDGSLAGQTRRPQARDSSSSTARPVRSRILMLNSTTCIVWARYSWLSVLIQWFPAKFNMEPLSRHHKPVTAAKCCCCCLLCDELGTISNNSVARPMSPGLCSSASSWHENFRLTYLVVTVSQGIRHKVQNFLLTVPNPPA